jgi:hypothetical protein
MKGKRKIHKHRFLSQGTGGNEEKQTKKAWIISGPFPALKPIKPIVDIHFMNTFEKYKMFLITPNNRLRKIFKILFGHLFFLINHRKSSLF